MKTEGLRVLTTVPAAPTTLYLAWLSSEQHAAMTSGTAKFEPTVGFDFSALSGYVTGKLIVLDLGRRLVMSWRTTDFPREAPDSKVEVFLEAMGGSSRVTVLHQGIPEGQGEKYKALWNDQYFAPMRAFFSKFLPDPREPPPPRRPIPPPDEEEEEIEEPKPRKGAKPEPKKTAAPARPEPKKAPAPARPEPKKAAAPTKPEPEKAPAPTKPEPRKAPAPAKPEPRKAAKPEPKAAKPEPKAAKPEPKVAKKPAKPEPKPAKKPAQPEAKKAMPAKKAAPTKKNAAPPAKKPGKKK